MPALDTPKKPAQKDWNKADIKAALEKAGWTCRQLAKEHGKAHSYFSDTLVRPNPKAEEILAKVLRQKAARIWPSRYDAEGQPKRGLYKGTHNNGRDYLTKSVRSRAPGRNGNVGRGA